MAMMGRLYFNHGVANNDFLRVGGKDVEGTFVPASPVIVASQLPETHPAKKRAEEYIRLYEAAYGPGSVAAFGSYTWDACLELANAIPVALRTARPGTVEFAGARDGSDTERQVGAPEVAARARSVAGRQASEASGDRA
jgi:branched-chain amino acid transport system substrate-binding protein